MHEFISDCLAEGSWIEVEKYFNESELAKRLGFSVSLQNPEAPQCEVLHVSDIHLGGGGQECVNGAVISAMLDFVLGLTGLKYAGSGRFATCSLNIEIAKPIKKGRFYAIAKCSRKIDRFVFSEATVFNFDDEPCVYATGRLRVGISND